jgi:quinol monooxygenase YgiN
MMYLVIANVVARPERRQDLVDLLTQFVTTAHTEKGCLTYTFAADIEDENSFSSIETWTDRGALEAHLGSAELAASMTKLNDLVAGPPSVLGYQVDGDPVKFA